MVITERQFNTIGELWQMLAGFRLLFGVYPDVYIITKGKHMMPAGVDTRDGYLLFCDHRGHKLLSIGNRYLTVDIGDEGTTEIDHKDTSVTFHAAFFLP